MRKVQSSMNEPGRNRKYNRPITSLKLKMVLKTSANQSRGQDSFTREFYQTFREELTPILLKVFQNTSEGGTLPNSFYEAAISLIPKPDTRKYHTKNRILEANVTDENRCKNLQQNTSKPNPVQLLSRVQLFATPWTAAWQASLSITNSWNLLKLMSIEVVMPSKNLILCHPHLPPSIIPSIRVFSNESVLHIRWPKYWSLSFSISQVYIKRVINHDEVGFTQRMQDFSISANQSVWYTLTNWRIKTILNRKKKKTFDKIQHTSIYD